MLNLPLFLPGRSQNKAAKILAVDIGGTKTSFGLFTIAGANVNLLQEETYPSKNYSSFNDVLDKYLQEHVSFIPDVLSIGVAGPVVDGKVQLTNLSWSIDADLLQQEKGIAKVFLLNDLEATAYGLAGIEKDDLAIIHSGEQKKGNVAILAPGTGLGEAGLFWDGSCYRPFATEGGAREATSLVLKLKATGGLFLGGGIPPKIYPLLRDELFRQQFIQSDRMEPLLQDVPIHLILNSKAALVGAAYYGAFCD